VLEQRKIARFGPKRLVTPREDPFKKLAGFTPPTSSEGAGPRLVNDVGAEEAAIELPPLMSALPDPFIPDKRRAARPDLRHASRETPSVAGGLHPANIICAMIFRWISLEPA
jgi:hypothetical protein